MFLYKLSEIKDRSIQSIIRLLMLSSFDCALNYNRNKPDKFAQDYSQECGYQKCDYICDGVEKTKQSKYKLSPDQLDFRH